MLINGAHSQVQNTWDLFKCHESCFKVLNQTDTSLTDTTIFDESENIFYKFTEDSLSVYELNPEEKNCYMLRVSPYKIVNDSVFDFGRTQDAQIQTSATFKIVNDTLIYTELWLENRPGYVLYKTKVSYFFTIDCFTLPPIWWPQTECHLSAIVQNKRVPGSVFLHKAGHSKCNLSGQLITTKSSGINVTRGTKKIELNK
jgi:hypothetical protein